MMQDLDAKDLKRKTESSVKKCHIYFSRNLLKIYKYFLIEHL